MSDRKVIFTESQPPRGNTNKSKSGKPRSSISPSSNPSSQNKLHRHPRLSNTSIMIGSTLLAALIAFLLVRPSFSQNQLPQTSTSSADSGSSTSTASRPAYTPILAPNTSHWFSPPWYPSPLVLHEVIPPVDHLPKYPHSNWSIAISKAEQYILSNNLSLSELVQLATGVGWTNGPCVGNIPSIPRLNGTGFKGLCLEDSPLGVRFATGVSAFPAGVNLAATWDKRLARLRGEAMGQEHRAKGVHIALGPGMNLGRVPAGGRNWEMGGSDPYLSGEMAFESIKGLQSKGVQACAKHYLNNEQERNRTTSSSNVDDRTQHELYLHPFLKSVQAGVTSVMCSYNLVNSSWACQNSKLLNGLLKHELGFQGYVMSDWQATHSGVSSVLAGLDMTMPGDVVFGSNTTYFGEHLLEAVKNGSVPLERVQDMAVRILGGWFFTGQDEGFPDVNFDAFDIAGPKDQQINVEGDDTADLIREIGAASTVLLKNVNGTLPLKNPRSITLIGSDAGPPLRGPNGYPDRGGSDGTLAMGWGSGTAQFPYLITPLEAIQHRARWTKGKNKTSVDWFLLDHDLEGAKKSAKPAEVAIVFISSNSGEEYIEVDGNVGDRNNLTAWNGGDELVKAVASVSKNVVVVVHSVGEMIMEEWIDNENVTAVIFAGLPGQESGNSLADILYGGFNPTGKLPYTIAKNISDYPAQIVYVNTDSDPEPQVTYTEELEIDYRHFMAKNITPRYGFGYGLSYTTFELGNISVYSVDDWGMEWNNSLDVSFTDVQHYGGIGEDDPVNVVGTSLSEALHKQRWEVQFDIVNSGPVRGGEIVQLYIGFPTSAGEPPALLRGFEKIPLNPGESCTVTFPISRYDISIWNSVQQRWTITKGDYKIWVVGGGGAMSIGSKDSLNATLRWDVIYPH